MTEKTQTWLDTPTNNASCAIIAEVAQNHDGSLGVAHAHIDAAANAGADAIKFQTHIAEEESTSAEPWRTKFSYQDESRMDYWKRMEFTVPQWQELKRHADDVGLHFLSSPFSNKAVELLENIGVGSWKIASGEITNTPLLDCVLATNKPIILSTGLSVTEEISEAVNHVQKAGNPLALLQCTSQYPCSPERLGINVINQFRSNYRCAVGLSDHSGTIYSGLAAASQGIQVLEVHITLSREMFGPDVIASITTQELKSLIEGIRFIETVMNHPVDKSSADTEAEPLRKIFMKSLYSSTLIKAGEIITPDKITTKKPGTGIPANRIDNILGKKAKHDIDINTMIQLENVE
ncbi:MAG: N-acetylneuraminate synthase family protein [Gammaproteobacteria bacterium]